MVPARRQFCLGPGLPAPASLDRAAIVAIRCLTVPIGDESQTRADVGGGQRARQAAWCGAVGAAQPEADLVDGFGGDRIGPAYPRQAAR